MKGMILAAGLGTRLKPFTDQHPKALAVVNGKTLLQRNIEYLRANGVKHIIVNVHHFADRIIDAVKNNEWGADVSISDESNAVLETGGGLKKAAHFLKGSESFILMNADILTDLDLTKAIKQHRENKPLATLAVRNRNTSRYLLFDEHQRLTGWLNAKTGERKGKEGIKKGFSGIHIIEPAIFALMEEEGKFSMIDLYLRLAPDHNIMSFDHSETKFVDVGRPESVAEAGALFE